MIAPSRTSLDRLPMERDMTLPAEETSNGGPDLSTPTIEDYPTLKKSLSASFRHHSQTAASTQSVKRRRDDLNRSSDSTVGSPPLAVNIPKIPGAAEAALAALQYLPTPLLVLSGWKTIVLANDAMGRLLGLDTTFQDRSLVDVDEAHLPISDLLRGQSLSQIGVDMLQDGQRIWVSWDVCRILLRGI